MGDRGDGRIQLKSVGLACSALIAESSTFSGVASVSSAAASAAACMLPYATLPSITYPLLWALPRESSARQGHGEEAKVESENPMQYFRFRRPNRGKFRVRKAKTESVSYESLLVLRGRSLAIIR